MKQITSAADEHSGLKLAYDQVGILGIPVSNLTIDDTVDVIDAMIEEGGFHQVATANLDFLTKAIEDEELREVLCGCELVVADGMPLVWASRLMGSPLKQRVTGADLLPRLAELSARKQRRIYLLGGTEERSRAGAESLERMFPGCQIAGRYSPPLGTLDELDHDHILHLIEQAKPDILLVAFGNPKQEKWLAMHRGRLQVPVCIGIGASLDFLSGDLSRAPQWMQKTGTEWVFRFATEPRRLARRYFSNVACILRNLSFQVLTVARQKKKDMADSRVSFGRSDRALIANISGRFSGTSLEQFIPALNRGLDQDDHLILDLTQTTSLGADALGLLARLGSQMAERGQDVWFTGMRPDIRRVLRTSLLLGRPFRVAPKVNDVLRRVNCTVPASRLRFVPQETFTYEISLDPRTSRANQVTVEAL